jgi:hypothetical protein
MTDKAKRAISLVVYILFGLAAGLYATVYLGAEFHADWAVNLKQYLEERWDIVLGGGTFAALFSLFRFFKVIKAKNDFSLDEVKKIGRNIGGVISTLTGTITELKEQSNSITKTIEEIKGIKETVGSFKEQMDVITDLLLLQTEKTSSDQTMAQIRLAYRQGKFLDRIKQLESIAAEEIGEEKQETERLITSAKSTVKQEIAKDIKRLKRI